jgi:hypothetical protein
MGENEIIFNTFWIQAVTQQNVKLVKGYEYFLKAHYINNPLPNCIQSTESWFKQMDSSRFEWKECI